MTDPGLHVVGATRRSLFDAVRPGELARQGRPSDRPGGMALAALRHPGVTGGDHRPADAVVLGGADLGPPRDGWVVTGQRQAVAVGYGVAAVRSRRSPTGTTWVLIQASALADGAALEAMAALGDLPSVRLCPVLVGAAGPEDRAGRAVALLRAAGLTVHTADDADAWSVLSALDHAVRAAEVGPVAVVSAGPVG